MAPSDIFPKMKHPRAPVAQPMINLDDPRDMRRSFLTLAAS